MERSKLGFLSEVTLVLMLAAAVGCGASEGLETESELRWPATPTRVNNRVRLIEPTATAWPTFTPRPTLLPTAKPTVAPTEVPATATAEPTTTPAPAPTAVIEGTPESVAPTSPLPQMEYPLEAGPGIGVEGVEVYAHRFFALRSVEQLPEYLPPMETVFQERRTRFLGWYVLFDCSTAEDVVEVRGAVRWVYTNDLGVERGLRMGKPYGFGCGGPSVDGEVEMQGFVAGEDVPGSPGSWKRGNYRVELVNQYDDAYLWVNFRVE